MNWDVTVQRFCKEHESVADISNSEQCVVLGSTAEVPAAIIRFFSEVNWSDTAWGIFESDHGSVEFNMGKEEPNTGFHDAYSRFQQRSSRNRSHVPGRTLAGTRLQ